MKRYEQAVRVITGFFAFLLGFGLRDLLNNSDGFPRDVLWPCFLMSVFLFLRFLLGSANHMWVEFVSLDIKSDYTAPRPKVINDFLFLVVFGLIGVAMCHSADVNGFILLNILLTAIGLVWALIYLVVGIFKTQINHGKWGYWIAVNAVQLVAVLSYQFVVVPMKLGTIPGPRWDIGLTVLAGIYLVILIWDFVMQLQNLENARATQ